MPDRHKDYENRVQSTEAERMVIVGAKLALNDFANEMWAQFGVERGNFRSMEEFKADIRFLREMRKRPGLEHDLDFVRSVRSGSLSAGRKFFFALVVIAAGSFALGFGTALKDWVLFVVSGNRHS